MTKLSRSTAPKTSAGGAKARRRKGESEAWRGGACPNGKRRVSPINRLDLRRLLAIVRAA